MVVGIEVTLLFLELLGLTRVDDGFAETLGITRLPISSGIVVRKIGDEEASSPN